MLDIAASIRPSERGELEISDINSCYLDRGQLRVTQLGRGFAWLDMGTHEGLLEAGAFVHAIEHRHRLKIMCLEEIGFELGYLTGGQVLARAEALGDCDYAVYLRRRVEELSHT